MDKKSIAYAGYWRISLADADLGNGDLSKKDIEKYYSRPSEELESGHLNTDLAAELFKDEVDDTQTVAVTFRPYVYTQLPEHTKLRTTGIPTYLTPVITQAHVDRDGRIFPSSTVIARDILDPLEHGSYAIGDISDLDKWIQEHQPVDLEAESASDEDLDTRHAKHWHTFKDYCREMLKAVAGTWLQNPEPFALHDKWLIVKNSNFQGASLHILPLYEHMRKANPSVPLFDRFASETVCPPEACLPANFGLSQRLGHASDAYPLAEAQRDALTHQLASRHGEILGVNGPPGTGKTTLLLSIVASHWVKAALDGALPPVIVAASTNNQAVTNIIDAFGKDFATGTGPFAGRWLPEVKSFGAYFPSASKEEEAAKKYQTRAFFDTIEEAAYVDKAKAAYLGAAHAAFPDLDATSLQDVVDQLQEELQAEVEKLVDLETAWPRFISAKEALRAELGDDPSASLAARQRAMADVEKVLSDWRSAQNAWQSFLLEEPWGYTLFHWIPPVGRRRMLRAQIFLQTIWPIDYPSSPWSSVDAVNADLAENIRKLLFSLRSCEERIRAGQTVMRNYEAALTLWAAAVKPVALGRVPETLTLADCDRTADTTIRFKSFLLATHYWEGRWLLEIDGNLDDLARKRTKTGRSVIEPRWRRRMMVTPCVVSTFYMLPKEMRICRKEGDAFVDDYLYDFADLLIVDEAGQALPEVAGASFALAKRALVIGDTLQIEPIWAIKRQVDTGNLQSAGILSRRSTLKDYERIADLGKAAASGSVMAIAQHATRYHYDRDLPRGMFLFEHRRCYDEIIQYCNALCYHGKLKPMRGKGAGLTLFPAMGYLHIKGRCEQVGGSRRNLLEAETIASWIAYHKTPLEKRYAKRIDEIVGVVTPFGGQVAAIAEACQRHGIAVGKEVGGMTVGTVHSLQGAERMVVLFSPTYSEQADGHFIDRRDSMLNVAVSRAKDSFLVFGDMDTFNPKGKGRPRSLLASFLLANQTNALSFSMPDTTYNAETMPL